MKQSNLFHYFIAALVIFFVGLMVWFFFFVPTVTGRTYVQIGSNKIQVEIADNVISQVKGLSGRDSLPENRGMLFVFSEPDIQKFWMNGMRFPLDIIWINGDTVVDVVTLNQPTAESPVPETIFSPLAVDKVLEINAGMVEKMGIRQGSAIRIINNQ